MRKIYVRSITFRCDEEINEFLSFLKNELKCSKQKVIEKCLLFAVSRPSDVEAFCRGILYD